MPSNALEQFQNDYPIHITRQVQWGEMDALQHVNNTVYFRYFENVRIEFMQRTGINEWWQQKNIGPILGHTQCKYLRPLTWPDTITIGTRLSALREKRFSMDYAVFSQRHNGIVAEGTGELVYFDFGAGHTVAIPAHIAKNIQSLL